MHIYSKKNLQYTEMGQSSSAKAIEGELLIAK